MAKLDTCFKQYDIQVGTRGVMGDVIRAVKGVGEQMTKKKMELEEGLVKVVGRKMLEVKLSNFTQLFRHCQCF